MMVSLDDISEVYIFLTQQISGKMATKNARRLAAEREDEIDGDTGDDLMSGFKRLVKDVCETEFELFISSKLWTFHIKYTFA